MYYVVKRTKKGVDSTESIPYPTFIINHFFPKFKGFNRLTPDEIQGIVLRPDKLATRYYAERLGFFKRFDELNAEMKTFRFSDDYDFGRKFSVDLTQVKRSSNENRTMYYSTESRLEYQSFDGKKVVSFQPLIDWKALYTLIKVLKKRKADWIQQCAAHGLPSSEQEFAFMYSQIWSIRSSNILIDKHSELSDNRHYAYFYDNVSEFYNGLIFNDILLYLVELMDYQEFSTLPRSPNDFPDNISKSANMEYWYHVYDKDKKIRDRIQPKIYYRYKSKRKIC